MPLIHTELLHTIFLLDQSDRTCKKAGFGSNISNLQHLSNNPFSLIFFGSEAIGKGAYLGSVILISLRRYPLALERDHQT